MPARRVARHVFGWTLILTWCGCELRPANIELTLLDPISVAAGADRIALGTDLRVPDAELEASGPFPMTVLLTPARPNTERLLWVEARDGDGPRARGRVLLRFPAQGEAARASVDLLAACERPEMDGLRCAGEPPAVDGVCRGLRCGPAIAVENTEVSAIPERVVADGRDVAQIRAQVRDETGAPAGGVYVHFQADRPGATLAPLRAFVGNDGLAFSNLTSTELGSHRVRILVSLTENGAASEVPDRAVVELVAGPVSAAQSSVVVSPQLLVGNGRTPAFLSIAARDAIGHPVASATISVGALDASLSLTQPPPADVLGLTTAEVRSSTVGTKNVQVFAQNPGGDRVLIADVELVFHSDRPEVRAVRLPSLLSSCVPVELDLWQVQDAKVALRVEFAGPDGKYAPATQAPSPPGESGVDGIFAASSGNGRTHVFHWNSTYDLPKVDLTGVSLRLTPSLGGRVGRVFTAHELHVDNAKRLERKLIVSVGARGDSAIAAADLNADGLNDLAVGGSQSGAALTVLVAARDGQFSPIVIPMVTADDLEIADLNRDGKQDLVTPRQIHFGRGDGNFSGRLDLPTDGDAAAVVVFDIDHDGWLDLVTANRTSGTISVLLADRLGGFSRSDRIAGSGAEEIVVVDGALLVTLNRGAQTISLFDLAPPVTKLADLNTAPLPSGLGVGDFNGDGVADVFVAANNGRVYIHPMNFAAGTISYAAIDTPDSLLVADFDGDRFSDLLITDRRFATLNVLHSSGSGFLPTREILPVQRAPVLSDDLVVTDLDADGDLDVAVASQFVDGETKVNIYRTEEPARCDLRVAGASSVHTGRGPRVITFGDVNHDGKVDLLSSNRLDVSLSIALGRGNGSFDPGPSLAVAEPPLLLEAADVDGDQLVDLISWSVIQGLSLWRGSLEGLPAAPESLGVTSALADLLTVDLDADGFSDLSFIELDQTGAANQLQVWFGDAERTFSERLSFPLGRAPARVRAVDFDADGRLDLIVPVSGDDQVNVWLQREGRTFVAAPTSPFAVPGGPTSVAILDLDRNSVPDMVVGRETSNRLWILFGDGLGGIASSSSVAVGTSGGPPLDAVELAPSVQEVPMFAVLTADALHHPRSLGLGSGRVTIAWESIPVPTGATRIVLSDVNGDGRPDVGFGQANSPRASVFLGVFHELSPGPTALISGQVLLAPGNPSLSVQPVHDFAIVQLTREGLADAIWAPAATGSFGVAPSAYSFTLGFNFSTDLGPSLIAAGTFNRDLSPDVALVNLANDTILVYPSAGGYGPAVYSAPPVRITLPAGSEPIQVRAADLDRDGLDELVVLDRSGPRFLIFRGAGGPSFFEPSVSIALPSGSLTAESRFVLQDLDGDALKESAVTLTAQDQIAIFYGSVSGWFDRTPLLISAPGAPHELASADFDRDGVLDLATSLHRMGAFQVMLGLKAAPRWQLAREVRVNTPAGPDRFALGDLDLDGRVDAALLHRNPDYVSVWFGEGDGRLRPARELATPENPTGIGLARFDINELPDIVVTSSSSHPLQIYWDVGPGQPIAGPSCQSIAGQTSGDVLLTLALLLAALGINRLRRAGGSS